MSLKLLVPMLLRVSSEPSEPHALHTHLKPLLQTARSARRKYHVELIQILSDGGGAGEIEEMMMWYALQHEKANDELRARIREGPWEDEKWRASYLERMERREFQIQILLYFLKLSLPGPPPLPPSPIKKKGKRSNHETKVEPSFEDCLEALIDKLSVWQLMDGVQNLSKSEGLRDKPLDWMQTFFEDIVKPQFEKQLPEMCALMKSKLFPHAVFSDLSGPSSPGSSRATSPDITRVPTRDTRHPSPALSTTSSKAPQPLVRNRSRSLSVSLAQERLERERSVTAGPSKKRVLNREVSMSRAFKPKPRPVQEELVKKKPPLPNEAAAKRETKRDEGVLLVEATPTRPKLGRTQSTISFGVRSQSSIFSVVTALSEKEDEEEWLIPGSSSPDILLLGPGRRVDEDDDVGNAMDHTPTKRSRLR
ncbi:hypothetical protein H0H87_008281 [Tephrocybe sp. NHM501043]|nr:hypothetical protein H0H87_008281 [Tephrocybe sp. NHM501043]